VTELTRAGFLAYTRTTGKVQVSACDGWDAFQVAETIFPDNGAATADARTIFYASENGVRRLLLTDAGRLVANGLIPSKWTPDQLRVVDGHLLASSWRRLLDAPLGAGAAPSSAWSFSVGFNMENVAHTTTGTWIVPMGDYGYELTPPSK
jgi:hypothetical protein